MSKIKTAPETVSYDVASDPNWTLAEWASAIEKLIAQYGADATMKTDAGYNNVDLIVTKQEVA